MTYEDETAAYAALNAFPMRQDDTHFYLYRSAAQCVDKYLKSNMLLVGSTPAYGNNAYDFWVKIS